VSNEAKALVKMCLDKEPGNRPSAKQALQHPWLQGNSAERTSGAPLASQVRAPPLRWSLLQQPAPCPAPPLTPCRPPGPPRP
jgi:serine/threonine protein kinase